MALDLYEASSRLGGRVASEDIAGKGYETGASIIHPNNLYMVRLSEKFGLKRASRSTSSLLSLFDGRQFLWSESSFGSWATFLSAVYRYGFDLYRHRNFVEKLLASFVRIYDLQAEGTSFQSVDTMLTAMDEQFIRLSEKSLQDVLSENGFSSRYQDELALAMTACNYGQGLTVHGMVGAVALAAASDGIWSIEGGNKKLVEALASHSGANIKLKSAIKKISLTPDGQFVLRGRNKAEAEYDAVVIATPLSMAGIQFENFTFTSESVTKGISYHRTVATMVEGQVSTNFTGRDVIVVNETVFFRSLGRLSPLARSYSDDSTVYKIFSGHILKESEMNSLFESVNTLKIADWLAYPHYEGMRGIPAEAGNLLLEPGLVYTSPIELAASAMEMSLISAKNAALLLAQHFPDSTSVPSRMDGYQTHEDVSGQHVSEEKSEL